MARSRYAKIFTATGLLALLTYSVCLSQEKDRVTFGDDLKKANEVARNDKKVLVIYFTIPACQWCRKMESSVFTDRKIIALSERFVWVKVDGMLNPDISSAFGVQGYPTLVFVNNMGQVLEDSAGYHSVEKLLPLLKKYADSAKTPGKGTDATVIAKKMKESLQAATQPSDYRTAVEDVVVALADPQRANRRELLDAMKQAGKPALVGLVQYLDDEKLAMRAAACDTLAFITRQDFALDPFAGSQATSKPVAMWRSYVASLPDDINQPAAVPATMPSSAPTSRP